MNMINSMDVESYTIPLLGILRGTSLMERKMEEAEILDLSVIHTLESSEMIYHMDLVC